MNAEEINDDAGIGGDAGLTTQDIEKAVKSIVDAVATFAEVANKAATSLILFCATLAKKEKGIEKVLYLSKHAKKKSDRKKNAARYRKMIKRIRIGKEK